MDLYTIAAIATIVGAGAAVIPLFESRRKRGSHAPVQPITEAAPQPLKKTFASSERMKRVIELMNVARTNDVLSPAFFAERLKMGRPGELEQLLDSTTEPTFDALERFADLTGADQAWLKFGKNQPFSSADHGDLYPEHCLPRIHELSPKAVLMIRSDDPAGRTCFLLRLDDLKYHLLHRVWHISDQVGGTGQGQLLSFYRAMKTLRSWPGERYGYPGGRILKKAQFDALVGGTAYPGSLINQSENPWWDDFTDLGHMNFGSEHYASRYGDAFLKAQEIVRWCLSKENSPTA